MALKPNLFSVPTKCILVFLFAICLNGCVTPQVKMISAITPDTVMNEEDGVVIARVINASSYSLPFNFLSIAPKNLNESDGIKPSRLQSLANIDSTNSVFASYVSPGQYSLQNIRSFYSAGDYWYSRWVSGKIQMGTFEVKPGQVTDLGTIIYYPKIQGDKYIDTLIRSPESEAVPFIGSTLPFLRVEQKNRLTWDEDDGDEDRRALYSSAVRNPVIYNERYKAEDNSIYFVGKLGAVLLRDANGDWSLDAVDTDSDLKSVLKNKNGILIVGGEEGSLFIKRAHEWENHQIDKSLTVEHMVLVDENTVDLIVKSSNEIKVLRGNINEKDIAWNALASYKPYSGWFDKHGDPQNVGLINIADPKRRMGKLIDYVDIEEINNINHLFLTLQSGRSYSVFNSTKRQKFTYDPGTWKMTKSKGFDDGVSYVLQAGAVDIGVKRAGFWSMTGADSYKRYDSATNSWVNISTKITRCKGIKPRSSVFCFENEKKVRRNASFTFLSVPVFRNEMDGVAFVKVKPFYYKTKKLEKKIVITEDGGVSWKDSGFKLPSEYCSHIIPELEKTLLVTCYGVSSDFYESKDWGKTWEHVREQEDI